MPIIHRDDGRYDNVEMRFERLYKAFFSPEALTTESKVKYAKDIFGNSFQKVGATPERYHDTIFMVEHGMSLNTIKEMGLRNWARVKASYKIKMMLDVLERHWDAQERIRSKREQASNGKK